MARRTQSPEEVSPAPATDVAHELRRNDADVIGAFVIDGEGRVGMCDAVSPSRGAHAWRAPASPTSAPAARTNASGSEGVMISGRPPTRSMRTHGCIRDA